MIRIQQRHRVHVQTTEAHHFNEFPELSSLGKWLETDGQQWSCLSLADANRFRSVFVQITGWEDATVAGSHT